MLRQIIEFVLPRVSLSIEHRRNIRPGHVVIDSGLNMIADGRSGGRNFGRGLLDRRDAPVAGRADREDQGQTCDCQTEQLPLDSHDLYLCSRSSLERVRAGLSRTFVPADNCGDVPTEENHRPDQHMADFALGGRLQLITSAIALVTLEKEQDRSVKKEAYASLREEQLNQVRCP